MRICLELSAVPTNKGASDAYLTLKWYLLGKSMVHGDIEVQGLVGWVGGGSAAWRRQNPITDK